MDPTWLGIPLEAWWIMGGSAAGWVWLQGMKAWDRHHPIKQAWCQGCDMLQPSACFRWNAIGLYRCGNCLQDPPLLDRAKHAQALQDPVIRIAIETGRK